MRTLFAFSLLIPLLGGMWGSRSSGSNPRPDGPCRSYEYRHSGTMMYPITYYEVKRDAAGAVRIAYLKDQGPDVLVIPGPDDLLAQIDTIVAKEKTYRLKNSYWPRMEILDGYMWHVHIVFDKTSISSGGNNAWPSAKVWKGVEAINARIQALIDASSEADVLERMDYRAYTDR